MDKIAIQEAIKKLAQLNYEGMYQNDFLLTWEKSQGQIEATFAVAQILKICAKAYILQSL